MKIRWTEGSVRLRITPSELAELQRNNIVRETVQLCGGQWSASITPGCAISDVRIVDGSLQVNLSYADRNTLTTADAEGVYFESNANQGVRFYIEKDFPCAHPRPSEAEEPETEVFIPPANFNTRKAKAEANVAPASDDM